MMEGNRRLENLVELHGMGIFLEQENTRKFQKGGLDGLGSSWKALKVDRRLWKVSGSPFGYKKASAQPHVFSIRATHFGLERDKSPFC